MGADVWDVLDGLMSALDRISTISEGTPKEPLATIHGIAGEAIEIGNQALRNRTPAPGGGGGGGMRR